MMIHPYRLDTLGIMPIMLTILVNTPSILTGTLAQPQKIIIDFDISSPLQTRVEVTPSKAYPGGLNYTIKNSSMHRYIIGRVRDGQEVIMDGDPMAVSRYILVHPREDCSKYIRILTRWRITGSFINHIDEFVRSPNGHYSPIVRTPVNVDVLTQDIDQNVHVELVVDWEGHEMDVMIGRTNGVFPENLETLPVKFTVQENKWPVYTIGVVRYGRYILDDKVEGLMTREVIWYGGVVRPHVTITSQYTSGEWVKCEYIFSLAENSFVHSTRKWQMSVRS